MLQLMVSILFWEKMGFSNDREPSCILARQALCGWDSSWLLALRCRPVLKFLILSNPRELLLLFRPLSLVAKDPCGQRMISLVERGWCNCETFRCTPLIEKHETPQSLIWDPGKWFPAKESDSSSFGLYWNPILPNVSPTCSYLFPLAVDMVWRQADHLDKIRLWYLHSLTGLELPLYICWIPFKLAKGRRESSHTCRPHPDMQIWDISCKQEKISMWKYASWWSTDVNQSP